MPAASSRSTPRRSGSCARRGARFAAYRALRERYGILELAKTPDLCAEVTLMPVRELGVDAAVLFADIMLPLEPMGVGLRIEPEVGPIIDQPIRSAADVEALRAVRSGRGRRSPSTRSGWSAGSWPAQAGVIGFSGAPFTLACYLIEGRPSRDFAIAKAFMYREPGRVARPDGAPLDDGRRPTCGPRSTPVPTSSSCSTAGSAGSGRPTTRAYVQPHVRRIFASLAGRADDPLRDGHRGPARGDGRGRRRRDRARPPPSLAEAGAGSATTEASRATSTRPACSPAGTRPRTGAVRC